MSYGKWLDVRETFFSKSAVKPWNLLPRKGVESQCLEGFNSHIDVSRDML